MIVEFIVMLLGEKCGGRVQSSGFLRSELVLFPEALAAVIAQSRVLRLWSDCRNGASVDQVVGSMNRRGAWGGEEGNKFRHFPRPRGSADRNTTERIQDALPCGSFIRALVFVEIDRATGEGAQAANGEEQSVALGFGRQHLELRPVFPTGFADPVTHSV